MSDSAEVGERILLRQRMLDIADHLEARGDATAAVADLREVAESDADALDETDIEIDFEAGSEIGAAARALLPFAREAKAGPADGDPVEAALLAAIRLRDRNGALAIIGDRPGDVDRSDYDAALAALRDALNAAIPVPRITD